LRGHPTSPDEELRLLAEEQAALRRVATLVAREPSPEDVFAAVAEEVGRLLRVENTLEYRFEADGAATVVAIWGEPDVGVPIGTRVTLEGESVAARVHRTGRPARFDNYTNASGAIAARARSVGVRSAVGTPIVVEGRLWGAMVALSRQAKPLPTEAASRIEQFTQLVATAISNTEARAEAARLAEEQAALRRVATLVARGASPAAVFEVVATEAAHVLDTDRMTVARYEPDGTATVVADQSKPGLQIPVGTRLTLEGESVTGAVLRSGRLVRRDRWEGATGSMAALARKMGLRLAIGVPILVEGRVWGSVSAGWTREEPPPADMESRMAQFTELVATAIANADSRAEVVASRARVLAAGDDARRRVVRDLHDGAQQRMVHTILTLQLATRALREHDAMAESLVAEALDQAEQANAELRELAQGILPSVLTQGGLLAGVNALVSRIDVSVTVDVSTQRLPLAIEASAYFVVAEALTNVIKHSKAQEAVVRAGLDGPALLVEVRDDGVGGANRDGAGLVGLDDRVAALGGALRVESPAGGGTLIAATLPVPV
jgi:signal transduction histidine kinase